MNFLNIKNTLNSSEESLKFKMKFYATKPAIINMNL